MVRILYEPRFVQRMNILGITKQQLVETINEPKYSRMVKNSELGSVWRVQRVYDGRMIIVEYAFRDLTYNLLDCKVESLNGEFSVLDYDIDQASGEIKNRQKNITVSPQLVFTRKGFRKNVGNLK